MRRAREDRGCPISGIVASQEGGGVVTDELWSEVERLQALLFVVSLTANFPRSLSCLCVRILRHLDKADVEVYDPSSFHCAEAGEVWEGMFDAGLARSGSKNLIGIEEKAGKESRA